MQISDAEVFDLNNLYRIALNEIENDEIQQINLEFYTVLSQSIGKLKTEEYSGIEAKIKTKLVEMTSLLTELILKIRLEKATTTDITKASLIDEEKFVIDSSDEMEERNEMILFSTLNGKTKVLESISQKHKTKPVSIRFLKDVEEIVAADSEKYGPFKSEDIATIPNKDAQELITKNLAVKVQLDD
jgi:DNA replication factor GINS|tara:strand:- start:43 stop:603 length:561 start_codon:yes stop_codon:yes gene_type:complete